MSRLFLVGLFALSGVVACSDTVPPTAIESPAAVVSPNGVGADRVTAAVLWNRRTREIIGRQGGNSNDAARTYALVSVAQYDAVIAAEEARTPHVHPSVAGASAAASAAVLAALYPAEQTFIADALLADREYFPGLPSEKPADFDAGVAAGDAVAAAVLARAATDGSNAVWMGTVPTGPGYWIPAPPPAKPSQPLWGSIRPWLMTSGHQFRPAPPPAYGSPEYLESLAEVRHYSDTRTAEQLVIAQFWAGAYGPGGPAGFFGNLAGDLAMKHHLDERKASRMLAVLHMAIMDASIGCYDAKYAYWYIRPWQDDPAITTPVGRPNFPSYPSAHSCLSAAAGGVLSGFFPAAAGNLRELVTEAGWARIYGGLHFDFDITAGRELGEAVAGLALRRAPDGHRPIPLN